MNTAFSVSSLRELEVTMNIYLNDFIDGVMERAERNDGVVEMNEWFHNLSFDVFSRILEEI